MKRLPLPLRSLSLDAASGPLICAPLIGVDEAALELELGELERVNPDLLEWRIDFFAGLGDPARCVRQAQVIRQAAAERPVILTRRSVREGGQPIGLDEQQVLEHYRVIAESGAVDVLDWELAEATAEGRMFAQVRALATQTATLLLASSHDFARTPDVAEMLDRLTAMQAAGADIAKLAVMPNSRADVLSLLSATLQADDSLEIPVATMAMGVLGLPSRTIGWKFGSAITFGLLRQASAPGQIPVEVLRQSISLLRSGRA